MFPAKVRQLKSLQKNIEDNKHLNAFLEVFAEEALARSKEIQKKFKVIKKGDAVMLNLHSQSVLKDDIYSKKFISFFLANRSIRFFAPYKMFDLDLSVAGI